MDANKDRRKCEGVKAQCKTEDPFKSWKRELVERIWPFGRARVAVLLSPMTILVNSHAGRAALNVQDVLTILFFKISKFTIR